MRFRLIDAKKAQIPIRRACRLLGISESGFYAWRHRPASRRQREDMVILAHIRNAFALSNETYGSPRMTRDLTDEGFVIGRRRVARLMRENKLQARRKRRFRRTTDSGSGAQQTAIIAGQLHPICLPVILQPSGQIRSGTSTSPMSGPRKGGCIWRL